MTDAHTSDAHTSDPRAVAETYFRAWQTKDYELYRSILADDVVFDGPLGHEEGREACATAFEGLGNITREVIIEKMFVDGADVTTWFRLHTEPASLEPPFDWIVNWSHIVDGRITRIRVTFDPRPLLAAG